MKKLKKDKKFAPCLLEDGDEYFANGIFTFNITKMYEFIAMNPSTVVLEKIAVSTFFESTSSLDEKYLEGLQRREPIIMAEIAPGQYNLLDGHHRVERAKRDRVEYLYAYKFSVQQHTQFLTDVKSYLIYVTYWNDKVKEKLDDMRIASR